MHPNADCMIEAEGRIEEDYLLLRGSSEKCQKVSISGIRKLQVEGETGAHPIDSTASDPRKMRRYRFMGMSAGRAGSGVYRGGAPPEVPTFGMVRARFYVRTSHGAGWMALGGNPT